MNLAAHIRNTVANFLQAERDIARENRHESAVGTLAHTPGALTGRESGETEVQLGMLDGLWCVHVRLGGEMVGTWVPTSNMGKLKGSAQNAEKRSQERRANAVLRIAQIAVADALRAVEAA